MVDRLSSPLPLFLFLLLLDGPCGQLQDPVLDMRSPGNTVARHLGLSRMPALEVPVKLNLLFVGFDSGVGVSSEVLASWLEHMKRRVPHTVLRGALQHTHRFDELVDRSAAGAHDPDVVFAYKPHVVQLSPLVATAMSRFVQSHAAGPAGQRKTVQARAMAALLRGLLRRVGGGGLSGPDQSYSLVVMLLDHRGSADPSNSDPVAAKSEGGSRMLPTGDDKIGQKSPRWTYGYRDGLHPAELAQIAQDPSLRKLWHRSAGAAAVDAGLGQPSTEDDSAFSGDDEDEDEDEAADAGEDRKRRKSRPRRTPRTRAQHQGKRKGDESDNAKADKTEVEHRDAVALSEIWAQEVIARLDAVKGSMVDEKGMRGDTDVIFSSVEWVRALYGLNDTAAPVTAGRASALRRRAAAWTGVDLKDDEKKTIKKGSADGEEDEEPTPSRGIPREWVEARSEMTHDLRAFSSSTAAAAAAAAVGNMQESENESESTAGCDVDVWVGGPAPNDRFAWVDLSPHVGRFAWGPAVGGSGVRTTASLPDVTGRGGRHLGPNDRSHDRDSSLRSEQEADAEVEAKAEAAAKGEDTILPAVSEQDRQELRDLLRERQLHYEIIKTDCEPEPAARNEAEAVRARRACEKRRAQLIMLDQHIDEFKVVLGLAERKDDSRHGAKPQQKRAAAAAAQAGWWDRSLDGDHGLGFWDDGYDDEESDPKGGPSWFNPGPGAAAAKLAAASTSATHPYRDIMLARVGTLVSSFLRHVVTPSSALPDPLDPLHLASSGPAAAAAAKCGKAAGRARPGSMGLGAAPSQAEHHHERLQAAATLDATVTSRAAAAVRRLMPSRTVHTEQITVQIFVVAGHHLFPPVAPHGDGFDLRRFKSELRRLRLPHQQLAFSVHHVSLDEDPALAMAVAMARRTAVVPSLSGEEGHTLEGRAVTYLDSLVLQHQLASLPSRGENSGNGGRRRRRGHTDGAVGDGGWGTPQQDDAESEAVFEGEHLSRTIPLFLLSLDAVSVLKPRVSPSNRDGAPGAEGDGEVEVQVQVEPVLLDKHYVSRALDDPPMILVVQSTAGAKPQRAQADEDGASFATATSNEEEEEGDEGEEARQHNRRHRSHIVCNGRVVSLDIRDPTRWALSAAATAIFGLVPPHLTHPGSRPLGAGVQPQSIPGEGHHALGLPADADWLWSVGPSPFTLTSSRARFTAFERDAAVRHDMSRVLVASRRMWNAAVDLLDTARTVTATRAAGRHATRPVSLPAAAEAVVLAARYNATKRWSTILHHAERLDFERASPLLNPLLRSCRRLLGAAQDIANAVRVQQCDAARRELAEAQNRAAIRAAPFLVRILHHMTGSVAAVAMLVIVSGCAGCLLASFARRGGPRKMKIN